MIGEECVLEFFQGLESRGQDQGLQNCPRGSSRTRTCPRGLQHCSNAPENTGSDGTVSAGDQSDICCSADVNDEDDGSKTNDTNKNDEACLFECVGDNDSATSLPCPLCQFNWHSGKSCYSLC